MTSRPVTVTDLLQQHRDGSPDAVNQILARLGETFRQRAHLQCKRERRTPSLSTGDLVQEAMLRLWKNDEFARASHSGELFRAFARAMRQVLIDRARKRRLRFAELYDLPDRARALSQVDVLALNEALDRLADGRPRVAEVLEMRYFGLYEVTEVAEVMGVSLRTIERYSDFGRAWLLKFLSPKPPDASPPGS